MKEYSLRKLLSDKRFLYPWLVVLVAIPYIRPIGLPVVAYPWTKAAYDTVESIPEGSNVIVDTGFSPGSWAEQGAQGMALISHTLRRNCKLVFLVDAQEPPGVMMAERIMKELGPTVVDPRGKKYGVDWVNLGIVAGGVAAAAQLAQDFHATVKYDTYGTSLKELPLTKNIRGVADFALILLITTGRAFPLLEQWRIPYAKTIKIIVATMGMGLTTYIANWNAGIVNGLLSGIRGAAEYEALTKNYGEATKGMDAVNLSHIFAVVLLFAGNASFWIARTRKGKPKEA